MGDLVGGDPSHWRTLRAARGQRGEGKNREELQGRHSPGLLLGGPLHALKCIRFYAIQQLVHCI